MKNLKRLILAGIALVVLLAAGAYVAVKLAFPPAKIRELIRAKGSEALGRGVEVGEIRVRLFPIIKITVSEVNVANAPGFSVEPVIKLRELDLSVSFLSLLRFAPVIQQIKIISPEILYEVDARGRNNLEGLGGKKKASPKPEPAGQVEIPAAVALKSFVILDGKVRYRDAQTGRELILGSINQEVSLALDPRLQDIVSEGRLEIAELSVRDSASGLKKGGVRIALTHDVRMDLPGERLQIKKVEFAFQDIRVLMEGSIAHFITSRPEADLRVSAPSIALASVLKEVPANLSPEIPKLKAEGTASFQAHILGILDSASKPEIEASVQVRGGALRHADLPAGIERLEMDAHLRHDSLRLARLSLDMGGNPVRVEALVTDIRKIPQLRQLLVDAVLDLGNLAALAQRLGLLDRNIKVSGTETVKLRASGALDPAHPEKLSASGTVDLKNVALALPGKPPLRCDGRIEINNDRIVKRLAVKVGESDVSVQAEVSNYLALVFPKLAKGGRARLKADVRSANLNLDELLPPPPPDAPAGAMPAPPLAAYPPLPPVDADVTANLGRTRFMGLEMTAFKALATVRADGIKADVKGSVYSGSFASTVNLKPKSATDMGVNVKVNALRVEANDFISRLNDRVPGKTMLMRSVAGADNLIFGKLNLNMDLSTHGLPQDFVKNVGGAILFSIADGKLLETGLTKGFSGALSKVNSSLGFSQLTFGGMKGDFKVEDGKLEVRNLNIDNSPLGALQLAGKVGFDNALDLQLTEALPAAASKLVAGPASALAGQLSKLAPVPGTNASLIPTDKSGRALLYFAVGGLLTSPSFSLDAKRMAREGAAGTAKAALGDAVQKQKDEIKAKAQAEKEKLEAEARAKIEAEKNKAVDETKKQGRKVLKGLGF